MIQRNLSASETIHLSIVIAEAVSRGKLFTNGERVCGLLNRGHDMYLPELSIVQTDPSVEAIRAALKRPGPSAVLMGISSSGFGLAASVASMTSVANVPLYVAEQSVGSHENLLSAGQILSLLHSGVNAVFREYDYLAEDVTLQLILDHPIRNCAKAIVIGEPALRLKVLMTEVLQEWSDPDSAMVFRPELTFRVACALTQVPMLSPALDTREKIALELNRQGIFIYNIEDTRKTVGSLTQVWGLHTSTLHMLPGEARKRGFPDPAKAEDLYNFINDIDIEERVFTTASGARLDILYINKG